MKKLQAAVFIMMFLFSVPSFAYLGLSCNPENESDYEGVDCSFCHGPGANWDSLCGAFNPSDAIRIEYEKPRGCDEVSGTIQIKATVQGAGAPVANPGTACLAPFFEIPGPNGLDDMVENTAWGNIQMLAAFGVEDQSSTPQVRDFFAEIVERLTYNYRYTSDWYNTFEYKEPVRGEEPLFRLKEKLEHTIRARGITSVLVFGNYNRSTDFEMSGDAWPEFQEAIDDINEERGTSVEIGSITNNNYRLMDYEGFLRSQYLATWSLAKAAEIPAGKKVGIIGAAHGSSKTTRLYDISRLQNPILKQRIEDFVNQRIASIYSADTPFTVCYSEYANDPSDGLRGVGEQVWEWVNEGYDYILVYPMEWAWGTTEVWDGLHKSAVELVDPDNMEILELDERHRSETVLNGKTRLIIGESIFEQQEYTRLPITTS